MTVVPVLRFVECDAVMFGRRVTTLSDFLSAGYLEHGFSRFVSKYWSLFAKLYGVTSQKVFRKGDGELWTGLIWLRTGTGSGAILNAVTNIRVP